MTVEHTYDPVNQLVRRVMGAADAAYLDEQRDGGTGANCTRRAVQEALRCAIGNGLITLVPTDRWPTMTVVTPPYRWDEVFDAR